MEYSHRLRYAKKAVAIGLGFSVLTSACSSGDPKPKPTPTFSIPTKKPQESCTADPAEKWGAVPRNFNAQGLAVYLGVSIDDILVGGSFGPATCPTALPESQINSVAPPVIAVPGKGEPCAVVGLQEAPSTAPNAVASNVLAICSTPGTYSGTASVHN